MLVGIHYRFSKQSDNFNFIGKQLERINFYITTILMLAIQAIMVAILLIR